MNGFLASLTHGQTELLYYGAHLTGGAVGVCFSWYYAPHCGFSRKWAVCYTLLLSAAFYAGMFLAAFAIGQITGDFSRDSARMVFFLPLAAAVLAPVSRIRTGQALGLIVPLFYVVRGIGRCGCLFAGCCHGYACPWGIYNVQTGTNLFPIQLVDAVFCFVLVGTAIAVYRHRGTKDGGWRAFAMTLWLFGIMRFCLDFFVDNRKYLAQMSRDSFYAAAMVLTGLCLLCWLDGKKRREAAAPHLN